MLPSVVPPSGWLFVQARPRSCALCLSGLAACAIPLCRPHRDVADDRRSGPAVEPHASQDFQGSSPCLRKRYYVQSSHTFHHGPGPERDSNLIAQSASTALSIDLHTTATLSIVCRFYGTKMHIHTEPCLFSSVSLSRYPALQRWRSG